MKAKVTIIDDNGIPKGVYELPPSRTYKNDISTKYVFEFEYNQLNKEDPMLDKIRNEITMLDIFNRQNVIEIIDKYRERSEG